MTPNHEQKIENLRWACANGVADWGESGGRWEV
jgi:hypothetical protein